MTDLLPITTENVKQFLDTITLEEMSRKCWRTSIELETQSDQQVRNTTDKFGLPEHLPQEGRFNAQLFGWNWHRDLSGPSELNFPHSAYERVHAQNFIRLTNGQPWAYNPYRDPAGSCHIHFSISGPFRSPQGYATGPYEWWTILYNFMKEYVPLTLPYWLFGEGRAGIDHWCEPVTRRATLSQVKEVFEHGNDNGGWTHTYPDGRTCNKGTFHGGYPSGRDGRYIPYLGLQWNNKPDKALTLEFRLNEQHPILTFGLLNGMHLLIKNCVPKARSIKFNVGDDLSILLWSRFNRYVHGSDDFSYKVLDMPYNFSFTEDTPKLVMDGVNWSRTSWESPLDFFKSVSLFSTTSRMKSSIHAGKIFVLFANGLIPSRVPSYLLWDIPRLFNYVFQEGMEKKWCYKGGLLDEKQRGRYVDPWLVKEIKKEDDKNWVRI